MIINGLRLNQADEHLYHELIRLGYPEDRIRVGYRISQNYRSDFTIMAPGVSENPLAVFEVLSYSRRFPMGRFKSYAYEVAEKFTCPFYLYVERENSFNVMVFRDGSFVQTELPAYSDILTEIIGNVQYPSKLKLQNFTVFKSASFDFGRKVNVFIGANGTGKTHILKLMYSIFKTLSYGKTTDSLNGSEFEYVSNQVFKIKNKSDLVRRGSTQGLSVDFSMQKEFEREDKIFSYGGKKLADHDNFFSKQLIVPSVVFLPTRELLSIYPGFTSIFNTYKEKMPYDQTYYDTVSLLGLPELHSQNETINEVCSVIENAIGATFYLDSLTDRFMMQKKENKKPFEVDMAAEGWRKLGEILQLLKVGAIAPGSILFWDEPEANQNPALIKVLAQVIAKLGSIGVQIFLTTHSLFLLRELDILAKSQYNLDGIRYFNFPQAGIVETGASPEDLGDILTLNESIAQSERFMQMED